MIIRTIKSELKYLYYELCSINKVNIFVVFLFIGLYIFSAYKSEPLNTYTNGECYLIIQMVSIYILLRFILTGITLPNNIYEAEIIRSGALYNNKLTDAGLVSVLSARIILKALKSFIINFCSILILMSAWNLVVDIRNYAIIASLMFLGMIYMLAIGFLVNTLMQGLHIHRELIFLFEIGIFGAYYIFNNDSYLFPITIIMTQLSGIFENDILYAKVTTDEVLSYLPLWLSLLVFCILMICASNFLINIILASDTYKRLLNEK